MDIPKSFRPEKISKPKNLKSPKKKLRSLKDLILDQEDLSELFVYYIRSYTFKTNYPFLNTRDILDAIYIDYNDPAVDILEFSGKDTLKQNINNIIACVGEFNRRSNFTESRALVKDAYVIFVYTMLGNCYRRTELTNAYKKKFGFKELKAD